MAWSKAKTAITVGAIVLLAAGSSIVGFEKYEASNSNLDSWRIPQFAPDTVAKAASQVRILPTKFQAPVYGSFWAAPDKWAGVNVTVSDLARTAYNWSPGRIFFPAGEPPERYDFATTLSRGNREALQGEIKKTLGLVGHGLTITTNVFVLKVRNPDAPGLKPHTQGPSSGFYDLKGHIISKGFPLSIQPPNQSFGLARYLEAIVQIPVIDETGLKGNYDVDFRWEAADDTNHSALKEAMLDQLGLELISTNRPVQMLVMQKAN